MSQIEEWEEIKQLSDKQYQQMTRDPRFPERLEKALGRNDSYWESYWESVSEVAHTLVNEYLDQDLHPACFSPEKDNPYPLCVGSGRPECRKCCLYAELEEEP